MNAPDRLQLADMAPSSTQALMRPVWEGFVGPRSSKFERRLGLVLWAGLVAVLLTID